MSWGITAGGKGAEAGQKALAQVEASQKHSQDETHKKLLTAIGELSQAFSAAFPEKIVVIESNGHVDTYSGYMNFSAKVYQA